MIFDEKFSRVWVISLDSPEGRKRARRALQELKEKGLSEKAEVFKAVDGRQCPPPAWWPSGNGAWGCMQSHYRLVQDAIRDGLESILLIEDDAIWQPRAAEMAAEFLEQVPEDWGQIYFGGQHRSSLRPRWIPDRPAVIEPYSVHRTHCYALRRSVMPQFLQHIIHAPDYIDAAAKGKKRHVDHQLEEAHKRKDWKIYTPSYWIAGQGENLSAINGKKWPAQWWHLPWRDSHESLPIVVIDREPSEQESKLLHIGNHPSDENPWEDDGVVGAEHAERLISILSTVSAEAFKSQRVPAIANLPEKIEWAKAKGKILIQLSENPDLERMANLAESKAVPHPWLNPGDGAMIDPADAEPMASGTLDPGEFLLHQVWIGKNPIPQRLLGYSASLKANMPGWSYKLWTDQDLDFLAERAVMPNVILSDQFPIGMRSDVIRLEILRQFGGAYFDMDFEGLTPELGEILEGVHSFGYADELSGRPSNAFMIAARPYDPFVEFYLRRIANNIHVPKDVMKTVKITGPERLAECLNLWVEDWDKNDPASYAGNRVGSLYGGGTIMGFWKEFFYPYHYSEGSYATFKPEKYPKAVAVHHWEGSWHKDKS